MTGELTIHSITGEGYLLANSQLFQLTDRYRALQLEQIGPEIDTDLLCTPHPGAGSYHRLAQDAVKWGQQCIAAEGFLHTAGSVKGAVNITGTQEVAKCGRTILR